MGAPRDIPHGAKIHKSVNDLHQTGVLSAKQLPQMGGDNPHITPSGALLAWSRVSLSGTDTSKLKKKSEVSSKSLKSARLGSGSYDVSAVLSHALANAM
jgi:hypothetical protein